MEVIPLQSGSNGNCIYVESRGVRLLLDAGISGQQAQLRLASHGRDIKEVQGLIISHEHRDHVCGMGVFHRKFGLPVYISEPTLRAANPGNRLGRLSNIRHFRAGEVLRFEHITVETIPTAHDAVDGVGFVIDDGTHRVGILTDLGHVFAGLQTIVQSLDAVLIESNYDTAMLDAGAYPRMLKHRISGPGGHLSNDDSAELLRAAGCRRLQWICLAHLSAENNHPELAAEAHRRLIGTQLPLTVASRSGVSDVLRV